VPKVEKIRGLDLPGTPWATSVCRGIHLLFTVLLSSHFYRQILALLLRTQKIVASNLGQDEATPRVLVIISGLSMQIIESYLKVSFYHFLSHAYM